MKNKYYRINKILNNNAIEILENGTEIIIIGNGVGFNHKVNDSHQVHMPKTWNHLQNKILNNLCTPNGASKIDSIRCHK